MAARDARLCTMLIPHWGGARCRRVSSGFGYLEAFVAGGNFVLLASAVVCATGFDVSYRLRYSLVGRDVSTNLAAASYISVAVPGYPKYFMLMEPNCLGGHGSLVEALNWTADYVARGVLKVATEDIKSVEKKRDVADAFVRYLDAVHALLVWTGACKSWYKRGTPLSAPRTLKLSITRRTPFRFMGMGFTAFEMDETSDLAWYVEEAAKLDVDEETRG
ncbi:hypothetical protein B0T24DRAFT_678486 [Lasiosphaeria ovina]|uniref:Uncharacterized protein n=1 Tax=Lasiosphaeria ovina TaxID=92902 RepID=A0AAE0N6Y4_9PEZI|nr:hypothetical protein B0T24DRAFT_678486 [Lasiosphaeria ovina]